MKSSTKSQKLVTGQHVLLRRALPAIKQMRLRDLADQQLRNCCDRPIYIAKEPSLGETALERYQAAGVQCLLKAAQPWLEAMIGREWLVLAGKILLRRTWPISEPRARAMGHNASNLTWHQDSNVEHGNRPMLVLMCVLQDGAGASCPGLSLLQHPVEHFEGVFGYEGHRIDQLERSIVERFGGMSHYTPLMQAGDLLVFDGLTFHRTYAQEAMKQHRDALLVRVVKPQDEMHFTTGPHWRLKVSKVN